MMDPSQLIKNALEARKKAYAPYSRFAVGAALLAQNGRDYSGCNVENASYGLSCCAERNAFFQAVARGERNFTAIALAGGEDGLSEDNLPECLPCGACLQVMAEFCDPESFRIYLARSPEKWKEYKLKDMLPFAFKLL
jgi:cytidine deaminase